MRRINSLKRTANIGRGRSLKFRLGLRRRRSAEMQRQRRATFLHRSGNEARRCSRRFDAEDRCFGDRRHQRWKLISDSDDVEVTSDRSEFDALTSGIGNVKWRTLTHHVATTCAAHAETTSQRVAKNLFLKTSNMPLVMGNHNRCTKGKIVAQFS